MKRPIALAGFAAALVAAGPALATQQGLTVMRKWVQMDKCAQQAQRAFPDFTAEANAKRDARLKACLNEQNLPPREPLSPGK